MLRSTCHGMSAKLIDIFLDHLATDILAHPKPLCRTVMCQDWLNEQGASKENQDWEFPRSPRHWRHPNAHKFQSGSYEGGRHWIMSILTPSRLHIAYPSLNESQTIDGDDLFAFITKSCRQQPMHPCVECTNHNHKKCGNRVILPKVESLYWTFHRSEKISKLLFVDSACLVSVDPSPMITNLLLFKAVNKIKTLSDKFQRRWNHLYFSGAGWHNNETTMQTFGRHDDPKSKAYLSFIHEESKNQAFRS